MTTFTRGPARRPYAPPATAQEAQSRFYARYGPALVGALLGLPGPLEEPESVEAWVRVAEAVRGVLEARQEARQRIKGE